MLTGEPINQFSVPLAEHHADQAWVTNEFRQLGNGWAKMVNFDDILCDSQICPLVQNGKFVYYDDDHLSIDGAMLVYPRLAEFLAGTRQDAPVEGALRAH
jgi:hypothetical protein